jgi:restriction system protein
MKNFIVQILVRIIFASYASLWITDHIDHFLFNHYHYRTSMTSYLTPFITFALLFCLKFIMTKIVIPTVMFAMTGVIPALIAYAIGSKFKMDWLTNHYVLQFIGFGIPALLLFGMFIQKYSSYFNAKSLEEIDNLGDGDPKKGGFLFESYVASLYNRLGYEAKTVGDLKKEGKFKTKGFDQGADVVVNFVENGVKKRAIIQCKLYSDKVSNKAIQEVVSALPIYQADMGIVLTNNFFTEAAIELAQANNVYLVDRKQLGALIEKAKNPKLHAMLPKNAIAA